TGGLYARIRHPQYSGLFLITIGLLTQWPTIITALTWPILIGMYVRLARREEAEMDRLFGDAYRAYAARVPMFIPRLRRNWSRLDGRGIPGGTFPPLTPAGDIRIHEGSPQ
ncbi:MAG TPA: isoprenylcysteine carboxylmethyltransferase family protein, partial [Candidatus Acidoferrum sp.]|nr:isoprenylcysteine carboxylmethyltransferase family protein [Candidatus Acidoferrum sp.]